MKLSKEIVEPLLHWYRENARELPWRRDVTPYHVWVSEIMLQQTRVEAVVDYYYRFMEALPTIQDLAVIDEEKLLKLWEGLGYYSRVRNLQKTAQLLCRDNDGKLPETYDELITLPGIGPYTAGAISSIAYQKKVAAVDGNVLRVVSRLSLDSSCIDEERVKKMWKEEIEKVMPTESGMFNQAMMEIGATICIPNGKPLCHACPLSHLCKAYRQNKVLEYPVRKQKRKREGIPMTVFLMLYHDRVAILKREREGLLANFYEFPNVDGTLSQEEAEKYLKEHNIKWIGIQEGPSAKHIFTHKEWHMTSYIVWLQETMESYLFSTGKELNEVYPIPSAFEKYRKCVENLWNEEAYLHFSTGKYLK